MRDADHCGFHDAGYCIDLALNFLRIDVEAAGNYEVLAAPDDVDIAALVDLAQVAGDEEAVRAEFGGGFLRHPPVALKYVRPFHFDHADFALREHLAAFRV